jgi:hypothetical protein
MFLVLNTLIAPNQLDYFGLFSHKSIGPHFVLKFFFLKKIKLDCNFPGFLFIGWPCIILLLLLLVFFNGVQTTWDLITSYFLESSLIKKEKRKKLIKKKFPCIFCF